MNKVKVNLDNNLILKSENIEYNNDTLKNQLNRMDKFKNLLYMNYSKGSSTTINGVTFTINNDGSITAIGKGTGVNYLWLINDNNALKLDDNKTYTWSLTTISGSFVDAARIVSKTTSSNFKDATASTTKLTFQGSYFNDSIKAFLRVQKDLEYNYTIKLQLEENDEATDPVPFAGYIVESGNNSNGSWVKLSDGTMICQMTKEGSLTYSAWGALFQNKMTDVTFPQEFISAPDCFAQNNGANHIIVGQCDSITQSKIGSIEVWSAIQTTTFTRLKIFAIGKWK